MTEKNETLHLSVDFGKAIGILQISLNEIYGLDKGRKNAISSMGLAILYLAAYQKIKMSDLLYFNDIAKSTVTDYIDNLEKKGLVKRERSDIDRREINIIVTEQGKEWLSEKETQFSMYVLEGLARIDEHERGQFVQNFLKFVGYKEGQHPYFSIMERKKRMKGN